MKPRCPKCGSSKILKKWNPGYPPEEDTESAVMSTAEGLFSIRGGAQGRAAYRAHNPLCLRLPTNLRIKDSRYDEHLDMTCDECYYYWEEDCLDTKHLT